MVGNRIYVKATATAEDVTGRCSAITVTAFAREPDDKKGMDASQITGTASSYARKYALNGLLCIDDAKDADTDAYQTAGNAPTAKQQQPRQIYCSNCKKPIQAAKGKDGRLYQPIDIYKQCRGLCINCFQASKGAGK